MRSLFTRRTMITAISMMTLVTTVYASGLQIGNIECTAINAGIPMGVDVTLDQTPSSTATIQITSIPSGVVSYSGSMSASQKLFTVPTNANTPAGTVSIGVSVNGQAPVYKTTLVLPN
jgi:hypothetical protein